MTYVLEAIVAEEQTARAFALRFPSAVVVRLEQGLGLVPLTEQVRSEIGPLEDALAATSYLGTVAHLEADFLGSDGTQCCEVWRDGELAFGPLKRDVSIAGDLSEGPFNQALRKFGVTVSPGELDEFNSVGLGRRRVTWEWPELAS